MCQRKLTIRDQKKKISPNDLPFDDPSGHDLPRAGGGCAHRRPKSEKIKVPEVYRISLCPSKQKSSTVP